MKKLKWVYKLLRSRSYILLTESQAVLNIPLADISSMENQFVLYAQRESLKSFRRSIDEVIEEHDATIKLLAERDKKSKKETSLSKKKLPVSKRKNSRK